MKSVNQMDILPIFPNLIFYQNVPVSEKLVQHCLMIKETHSGIQVSNRGGWQSPPKLHLQKDFCDNFLSSFVGNLRESKVIPSFEIVSCWLNVNGKGDYNVFHNHPNSDYSLVWYIKTPDNCGDILFENPSDFSQYNFIESIGESIREKYNTFHTIKLSPREGDCYLFPPGLKHLVEPNESEECRISMSCNLRFV